MYAATIDSTHYTFQASGSLWQDALVMQDRETKSLWSQISGECIQGPMKGKTLELFNSFHTTYAEFKELYPDGLVLEKPGRGSAGSHYAKYFDNPEKLGIFGRIDTFKKLPAKSKVYGLRFDGVDVAIAEGLLEKKGWVLVEAVDPPVIVTLDTKSRTVAAFSLAVGAGSRSSKVAVNNGVIMVGDSTVTWNASNGKALRNGVADLEPVPLLSSFWFAWTSFFPGSEIIQ